ncbi:CBS domain-containing protein [Kitasatospora sp. NBC_00240]|uniref:CBS domain-containing protein n=1 Tax=Kitasatospora sp. NBC_00240 TaxID=2903567 RepID=UPI002256BF0E|nr:CBS domain-containing protein [Kitasatospora sp. NBC_00240]MCX5208219.1 CBS domain-containing protein [Kitasatospora sp. NBC_00240]
MTDYQPFPVKPFSPGQHVPGHGTAVAGTAVGEHRATVQDRMNLPDLQISDDVLIDTAIDILRSAHVGHMLVRGHDGRCAGLLTSAQLGPYRRGDHPYRRGNDICSTSVDDIVHDRGPFAHASMAADTAATAMRIRDLEAWPVVDDDGYTVGLLPRTRA